VIIIAAVLVLVLVAAVGIALVVRNGDRVTPPAPPAEATSTTSTNAATSAETPPPTTEQPTQQQPSGAEVLDPFFAAAVTFDTQLRAAAAAINATGPPWEQIGVDVARQVRAADLDPVASAIPVGLPHDLLQGRCPPPPACRGPTARPLWAVGC
jgi:hypothetical protein